MEVQLSNRIIKRKQQLSIQIKQELSHIASACSHFWKQGDKIDSVLFINRKMIPKAKLIYAIRNDGTQISSNILQDGTIIRNTRGQNLLNRPYLSDKDPSQFSTLSPVYLSLSDRKPSITALHQVTDMSGEIVGYVAADFDIDDFRNSELEINETLPWRQIKGDPSIRKNLFQQKRTLSAMDEKLDQVNDIITHLVCKRGIFHTKLHYSSSRATLWPYERPYEYQLHVLDEIIDPDVCLAYQKHDYPRDAKVKSGKVRAVLERLKDLRNADETIYLRSGSLNVINATVGLTFSCDGSHYMSVDEFLTKSDSFWFGV